MKVTQAIILHLTNQTSFQLERKGFISLSIIREKDVTKVPKKKLQYLQQKTQQVLFVLLFYYFIVILFNFIALIYCFIVLFNFSLRSRHHRRRQIAS